MTTSEKREAEVLVQSAGWKVLRKFLSCAEESALAVVLDSCSELSDFSEREKALGKIAFLKGFENDFKAYIKNEHRETEDKS